MMAVIGTVMLSASVLGFGFSYNSALKAEKESLVGMIRLADRIRSRIECFRQPLCEIYADFSHTFLDEAGFTEELKKNGLSSALYKTRNRLGLRSEIFEIANEFAEGLGKSYAEEQVKFCCSYISKMEEALSELDKALPSKARLSLSLSAAAAAMAALLLL